MMQMGKLLRLGEAVAAATLVLALVLAPTGWGAVDADLAVVLAGMQIGLTAAVYALHAVTFDYFRLTGQRAARRSANPGPGKDATPVDGSGRAAVAAGTVPADWPFRYTHREG